MMEFLSSRHLLFVARFVLGMVFIVAAVPKIAGAGAFAAAIEAYEMLPLVSVNAVAIVVPWIELICGIFLVAGFRTRPAAAILGAMLVFFIAAISQAVLRGLDINCGCFGTTDGAVVGWGKVLEDVALLVPAWLLVRAGNGTPPGAGDSVQNKPS